MIITDTTADHITTIIYHHFTRNVCICRINEYTADNIRLILYIYLYMQCVLCICLVFTQATAQSN